jgi:hypothetical protein
MTAKTKHGQKAHPKAHGADEGTAHERLNRAHAVPNRPEGAPMSAAGAAPPPMAPPGMAPPGMPAPGGAPMGGGAPDDEAGEVS